MNLMSMTYFLIIYLILEIDEIQNKKVQFQNL